MDFLKFLSNLNGILYLVEMGQFILILKKDIIIY
jgi:hypothetical protein